MITDRQIKALKYLIWQSDEATGLTKQLLYFLIDASKGLLEPVSVSIFEGVDEFTSIDLEEITDGFIRITSSNCSFHQHALLTAMGSPLEFSQHYGHYEKNGIFSSEGQFGRTPQNAPGHEDDRSMPRRFTFWLAEQSYGHSGMGRFLNISKKELLETTAYYGDYMELIHE